MLPFARDISALSAHHSRPLFHEKLTSLQMGKTSWNTWKKNQWDDSSSNRSSWRAWQDTNPSQGSAPSAVWDGYKQVTLETETPKEDSVQQNYTMTQLVQRAVNVARRADQRHKKAALDLQQCQQKWVKYQAQLKELFLKQQDAFLKDQDALEMELYRTKEAAEQAELKLKRVLEAKEEDEAMECLAEKDANSKGDPWEQLIGGVNVETGNAYTDQQIAHALQHMLHSGKLKAHHVDTSSTSTATTLRTMETTAPRTPCTRTTGGMPVTPTKGAGPPRVPTIPAAPTAAMRPFYNAKGTTVLDPYLLSPSATSLTPQGGNGALTTSPLQRPIAQQVDGTRHPKQRTPIKEVGRQPNPRTPISGPSREEQLQAKRTAAMQEMQDTAQNAAHGRDISSSVLPQNVAIFTDDDDEELAEAGTATVDGQGLQHME